MKIILAFGFLFFSLIGFSQSSECSGLLKAISVEWKKDSMTSNGFRNQVYKQILECKKYDIKPEQLISYLGAPFEIQKWTQGKQKGVGYSYYYWNSYTIPNQKPFEQLIITFNFNEDGNFLYVAESMACR